MSVNFWLLAVLEGLGIRFLGIVVFLKTNKGRACDTLSAHDFGPQTLPRLFFDARASSPNRKDGFNCLTTTLN